jgi:membrane-bound metal-dependent hydrolase YbcI (DUF457 family)
MSIAYLLGKGSGKVLQVNPNVPLLMVLSILPDVDIIFDLLVNTEIHRGPTHSIFFAVLLFVPIFLIYRKRAVPYFLALISHSLLGDFFIGGQLQLFWPFSNKSYGVTQIGSYNLSIDSTANIVVEVTLFVAAMLTLYKNRDWKIFFRSDKTNLVLVIPIITVLLPSTVGYPFTTPLILSQPTLAMAHIIYLILFIISVSKYLLTLHHSEFKQMMPKPIQN